jgi:glycosyltransferase involved in cell wall biosynthesis
MNILYICGDWGVPVRGDKGASVHVREFVTALALQGHRVVLLCANRGAGNPDPPAEVVEIKPEPLPATRDAAAHEWQVRLEPNEKTLRRELDQLAYSATWPFFALTKLKRLGFAPDAVYERFSLFFQGGATLAADLGVPYLLEVNAPLIDEQERHRGLRLKGIAERVQRRCFRQAKHCVAVSGAVRDYVEAADASTEVVCLPNGVDVSRFHPDADAAGIRARHHLGDHVVMGFVGSLKPWHGLTFLFDAMRRLVSDPRLDCQLLLVGQGPEFANAEAWARDPVLRDRVVLTGRVPHADVPAYFAAMNFTVAPYVEADGFYFSPLKVMESLACGRPVIAPALGQLTEIVRDGETGLLYPPGDRDAFVDRVRRLAETPALREAMAREARRDAMNRMSWDRVAQRTADLMMRAA